MTVRLLYVLRHAKSSWDDPALRDHERPLSPRGRRAAEVLHQHCRDEGIEPGLVLCSSARRALETLERVNPAGGQRSIERELYDASANALLGRLRQVPDDTTSLMVIGHNPALQMLILRLVDDGPADVAEVRRKFPTGALATLEFDCPWEELGAAGARLLALVRPKQLAAG